MWAVSSPANKLPELVKEGSCISDGSTPDERNPENTSSLIFETTASNSMSASSIIRVTVDCGNLLSSQVFNSQIAAAL